LLNSLKALLKRIGLPTTGKLHTFRHSFISHALMEGVAPAIVRSWVGHVSDEILEHYVHVHHTGGDASPLWRSHFRWI
jgi:site-specific recombinase XerD